MAKENGNTESTPRVNFKREGYDSNTLRAKPGETDEAFTLRMTESGWDGFDKAIKHKMPESNMYHAGQEDGCKLCERLKTRQDKKAKASKSPAIAADNKSDKIETKDTPSATSETSKEEKSSEDKPVIESGHKDVNRSLVDKGKPAIYQDSDETKHKV